MGLRIDDNSGSNKANVNTLYSGYIDFHTH